MVQYRTAGYPLRVYNPRYRYLTEKHSSLETSETSAPKDPPSRDEQGADAQAQARVAPEHAALFRIFNMPILLDDVILIGLILLLLFNDEVHDNILLVLLVFLFFAGKETAI